MALLCVPWVTQAQSQLTVADGTTTNSYVPFYGWYMDSYNRSQIMYPDTMLEDMLNESILSMTYYSSSSYSNVSWTSEMEVKVGVVNCTPSASLQPPLSTQSP